MNENALITALNSIAVEHEKLATNFPEVVPDCTGLGADPKTEIQNQNPLYTWLLNTSLSRRVRGMINTTDGMCILHKDATTGQYVIEIPQSYWSDLPVSTAGECCWQPFDFAKCDHNVPVNRLCLKDCISIDDEILGRVLKVNGNYRPFASSGDSFNAVRKRIAKISMAYLTAYNVILGTDNNTTDILKPFHGLLEIMSNPAIVKIDGTDILSAFESLYCRLVLLGNTDVVIAVHPVIYSSILSVVREGQFGALPFGWTRSGDTISFHGMRFIQDKRVPLDTAAGKGEAWVLSGDAVGLWMVTDLIPADQFVKESGHKEESLADGCGSECTFYYNFGAAFSNNTNKLALINNIPVSAYCAKSISDLDAVVNPTTLIPKV